MGLKIVQSESLYVYDHKDVLKYLVRIFFLKLEHFLSDSALRRYDIRCYLGTVGRYPGIVGCHLEN